MYFQSVIATTSLLLLATTTSAAPTKRQAASGSFGLNITTGANLFNFNDLQTFRLAYANNSAYFGQIKYQPYSEPLVIDNDATASAGGLSFLSYHSAPTGWQYGYVAPAQTAPLEFTVPHTGGELPSSADVATGFAFNKEGVLELNGENKFWACQSEELKAIESFQVYWNGNGELPAGQTCLGPIGLSKTDGCNRGN